MAAKMAASSGIVSGSQRRNKYALIIMAGENGVWHEKHASSSISSYGESGNSNSENEAKRVMAAWRNKQHEKAAKISRENKYQASWRHVAGGESRNQAARSRKYRSEGGRRRRPSMPGLPPALWSVLPIHAYLSSIYQAERRRQQCEGGET